MEGNEIKRLKQEVIGIKRISRGIRSPLGKRVRSEYVINRQRDRNCRLRNFSTE